MTTLERLCNRLYFDPAFTELARYVGYAGKPDPAFWDRYRELCRQYPQEVMSQAVNELTEVDRSTEPATIRLTPTARKLCWQLLGPPPEHPWYDLFKRPGPLPLPWSTPAAATPNGQPLDPAAEADARRRNNRQLRCMLRDAREHLEHHGRHSFMGKEAKKRLSAAEAEFHRRGIPLPPPGEEVPPRRTKAKGANTNDAHEPPVVSSPGDDGRGSGETAD